MTDIDKYKGLEAGRMSSALSNAKSTVAQRFTRIFTTYQTADGGATDNVAERMLDQGAVPYAGTVKSAYLVAAAAVTANATNYAVVTLQTRDDAGGSAAVVGRVNTAATNLSAWVAKAFTLNTSNLSLAALAKLTYKHDKTGAGGTQLPAYTVTVLVEDA